MKLFFLQMPLQRNISVHSQAVADHISAFLTHADTINMNAIVSLDMSAKFALKNSDICTSLPIIVNRKRVTKFIYLFKFKNIFLSAIFNYPTSNSTETDSL